MITWETHPVSKHSFASGSVDDVLDATKKYVENMVRLSGNSPGAVLDIDDTCVFMKDNMEIPYGKTASFYHFLLKLKIKIHFVTARPNSSRGYVSKMLANTGYGIFDGLWMHEDGKPTDPRSISCRKHAHRRHIRQKFCSEIVVNVGNYWGDLMVPSSPLWKYGEEDTWERHRHKNSETLACDSAYMFRHLCDTDLFSVKLPDCVVFSFDFRPFHGKHSWETDDDATMSQGETHQQPQTACYDKSLNALKDHVHVRHGKKLKSAVSGGRGAPLVDVVVARPHRSKDFYAHVERIRKSSGNAPLE
jgi:hypothetical protein